MIHFYGVSKQGAYHVKNDIVCQDSHCINIISDVFAVGAVADGLGSEKYTDVASKIAADTSVKYCSENISVDSEDDEILKTIKKSFELSLNEIKNEADSKKHDINEYDTTLALAVYINDTVYYGNSGDSGIIVLNKDGTYEAVTIQQRDENGCVFPLWFGEEKWAFGQKKEVASVFLATDGMFESLFPYLLKDKKVPIYVALAHFMMNNESLRFGDRADEEVQKNIEQFIESIPSEQVQDDKTVLLMLNTDVIAEKQPDDYYAIPDWKQLKEEYDKKYLKEAYSHLFED